MKSAEQKAETDMIKRMNKLTVAIGLILCGIALIGGVVGYTIGKGNLFQEHILSPLGISPKEIEKPLLKYSFGELKQKQFVPKSVKFVEPIATESAYTSWLFTYETDEGKISGQANIPLGCSPVQVQNPNAKCQKYPVIVMVRGYVEKEEYKTGIGTKNAAAVFAQQGYLTLAPDFLGYGMSDSEPPDDLQARFIRPASVLQLFASLANIAQADTEKVGLWGHSNGGQIALSVLELTNHSIPTTLWAPVSKPFPYSVLYYTDDIDDHGKYLRRIVSDFEKLYNAEDFSLINYFDWINSPIQLHQGSADEAVPVLWSTTLAKTLKAEKKNVTYYTYPGADHNLKPNWDTVVKRDVEFFRKELGK